MIRIVTALLCLLSALFIGLAAMAVGIVMPEPGTNLALAAAKLASVKTVANAH